MTITQSNLGKEPANFQLESQYEPAGDQPKAIQGILDGFAQGNKQITLLGATGTGKTFTMANIIRELKKPTLILSHNKTLAAQLATEFKYFFPNNAVHYFVSYFDYYQPESYLPEKGVYIEKEATINKEIEMFRLSTMASLLSREDSIVVSSVSALYGLGSKEFFETNKLTFEVDQEYDFDELKKQLIGMQYKPVQSAIEQGMFDVQGEMIDIYSSTEQFLYRLIFNDKTLEYIQVKDALTFELLDTRNKFTLWPATQYMQDFNDLDDILVQIEKDMHKQVAWFEKHDFLTEAQRLKKRVTYDIKMIKETGFVQGIENYSPYFEKRLDGAPPNTLFDYFPDDFLLIIDESHMTVPQVSAMPRGDASRKSVLVDHGFRLPTAVNHRPVKFEELQCMLGRKSKQVLEQESGEKIHPDVEKHMKKGAKTLFVSATPAKYEINNVQKVVEQIIRPTGLLDPITYVYPKSGSADMVYASVEALIKERSEMKKFFENLEVETIQGFN